MSAPVHGDFTAGDLWRGALWAWVAFVVLMEIALTGASIVSDLVNTPAPGWGSATAFLPLMLGYALVIGGGVSLLVMLVGAPLAALLAWALRGVTARALHVAAFAAFGAAIGGVAVSLLAMTGATHLLWVTALVAVPCCGAATAFGWSRAERHRRRPAGVDAASGADRDARAEDAIVDRW